MFTNIISIFEMASAINNQKIFDRSQTPDQNLLSSKREKDRRFLQLLSEVNSSMGSGNSLCQNIIDGMTNPNNNNFTILSNYTDLADYKQTIQLTSLHPLLVNGCDLNNLNHRVIISPAQASPGNYLLYSCIVDGAVCKFEVN